MTAELGSLLKPDAVPCPCGCGVESQPRVKRSRDGTHHARECRCRRCTAPTHRRNARRRENAIAKATGGNREPLSGALSGVDVSGPLVEIEETSNVALTRGLSRWWNSKQVQAKVSRLYKHGKMSGVPSAFVASWDGKPRLVVMTYVDFAALCQQRLEDET